MTIEIRQLVIRAIVEAPVSSGHERQSTQAAGAPVVAAGRAGELPPVVDHDALVAACVREVQRALRRHRGR